MAGEVDARDAQPGAPRDLQVDDREADRDAGAPVEHLVQEAVARIVVVLAVPREAQLVVEILVERLQRVVLRWLTARDARAGFRAHPIECREVVAAASSEGYSTRAIASAAGAQILPGRVHGALELARDLRGPRLQV